MLNTDFIEFLRVKLEAHSINAAEAAVNARMLFWDGVLKALPSQYVQAA
jgi:hypothetical protein